MGPRLFTSILLFLSAYSPLLLIFVVKSFDYEDFQFGNNFVSVCLIIVSTISICLMIVTVKSIPIGNKRIKLKSIKNRSIDVISYTIPYLFCAFDVDLNSTGDVITIIIFLVILMVLSITTKTVFINPILALFGYIFYEIEFIFDGKQSDTTLITNQEIRNGEEIIVKNISRFIVIHTPVND